MNDSDLSPLIKNKTKIKIETVTDDDDEKFFPLESEKQFLENYDSDDSDENNESDDDSENESLLTKYIYNCGAGKNNPLSLHAETVIVDPNIFYFHKTRRESD